MKPRNWLLLLLIPLLVVIASVAPFLPGPSNYFSHGISQFAQAIGHIGLPFVPFGLVWLIIEMRNMGWYFRHGGSNWGFRANMIAHIRKGYGLVTMTNSDSGVPVLKEIETRAAVAYGWDSVGSR